jgi:hypothetical protein
MFLLALNKMQLLSKLYTYIHIFIGKIKSEINLDLGICVYTGITFLEISIFFHIVPAALYEV